MLNRKQNYAKFLQFKFKYYFIKINLKDQKKESNMKNLKTVQIIIFALFLWYATAYLQFKLVRVPHETKVYNPGVVQCMTDLPKGLQKNDDDRRLMIESGKQEQQGENEDDQQDTEKERKQIENKKVDESDDFKQICYQKDISYSIELYNKNKQLLLVSIDLTVPISWFKGEKCFIAQTHKKCSRIENNYGEQIAKIAKKFKGFLQHPFRNKSKKKKTKSQSNQYALIEGSSQVVKGILQKTQQLSFLTKDSGRLMRLFDVILLGLGLIDVNANLKFTNTSFISATSISPSLNYLCDGAISLRFDQNSESSFLKQMSALAKTTQTFVTIFIGEHNQSMTIGDLSVKNSGQGLAGVHWIPVIQDELHGKLPRCKSIQLTASDNQAHKQFSVKMPMVMTLGSSSITIPADVLQTMFEKFFKKSTCVINQTTRYVQCDKMSLSDIQTKQLNFVTNQTSIMIPLKKLVLSSKKRQILFNIKSSLDSRYIVLGQPFFKKYFVVLDYENNRIGISMQRTKFVDALFDVVYLIRFVVWAFILGCCCICFALPIQRCYTILVNKLAEKKHEHTKKKRVTGTKEEKAKINVYTKVEEDPYADLQGKIQEILHDEAEGI